eukprot:gene31359-38735_t
MESHLLADCPLQLVECPLKALNVCRSDCTGWVSRASLESHVVGPARHNTAKTVTEISDRLKQLDPFVRKTLAPSVEALTARCSVLESGNESQKQASLKEQRVQINTLNSQITAGEEVQNKTLTDDFTSVKVEVNSVRTEHRSMLDQITQSGLNLDNVACKFNSTVVTTDSVVQRLDETMSKVIAVLERIEALERLQQTESEPKSNIVTTESPSMPPDITSAERVMVPSHNTTVPGSLSLSRHIEITPTKAQELFIGDKEQELVLNITNRTTQQLAVVAVRVLLDKPLEGTEIDTLLDIRLKYPSTGPTTASSHKKIEEQAIANITNNSIVTTTAQKKRSGQSAEIPVPKSVLAPDDAVVSMFRDKLTNLYSNCKTAVSWQGAAVSAMLNDIHQTFVESSFKSYLIYVLMLDPECGL